MTEEKPKKKMGRPPKDKQGKHMWIPSECLDVVQAVIATTKQQVQRQQVQQQ
jgi:hypothetical protein